MSLNNKPQILIVGNDETGRQALERFKRDQRLRYAVNLETVLRHIEKETDDFKDGLAVHSCKDLIKELRSGSL